MKVLTIFVAKNSTFLVHRSVLRPITPSVRWRTGIGICSTACSVVTDSVLYCLLPFVNIYTYIRVSLSRCPFVLLCRRAVSLRSLAHTYMVLESGRPPVRKKDHSTFYCVEEPAYGRCKATRYAQRERERGTKSITLLSKVCNSYKWTTTFAKGYKVTLYSDSLRATALYPIYTNGPNLG